MINMIVKFNVSDRELGGFESKMYLPMAMFKEHDEQAKRNHCGQDCERLCERHGIGADEAVAILTDKKFKFIDHAMAVMILMELYLKWKVNDG